MEVVAHRCTFGERVYAMKKHDATRLHYDLRLEWNGVLLSWALTEGPSCNARVVREAIEMADHRRAYLLFEGMHTRAPSCFGIAVRGNHTRNSQTSKKICVKGFCGLRCMEKN